MKKIFAFILIFAFLFSSCAKEEAEIAEENEIIEESGSSESEIEEENEILESCFEIEDGKLSGEVFPMVENSETGVGEIFKNELVPFSMSLPEDWKADAIKDNEDVIGINFKMPWDDRHSASFAVYKDTGTTYEDLLANHSLWVGINEHTYHEVSGDFSKGSYIHFSYPTPEKYDVEEGYIPVYLRMYQLQFDGYVVDLGVYVRIDSEENTALDEKICDEFVSSIKIG